jgi:hypothetical protein
MSSHKELRSYPDNGDRVTFFPRHKLHQCHHELCRQDLLTTLITSGRMTKAQIVQRFHIKCTAFHSFVAKARRKLSKTSKTICIHYDNVSHNYCVGKHTRFGFGRLQQIGKVIAFKFKSKNNESVKLQFMSIEDLFSKEEQSKYQAALKQNEKANTKAVQNLSRQLDWKISSCVEVKRKNPADSR